MVWRQNLSSIFALLPPANAAEQTKASWARPIDSLAAVPAAYLEFFEPLLASGRAFPYTVLTPSYQGFLHRATEKLVCDLDDEICILHRHAGTFEAHRYALEGISYVEVRTFLLDSSIKIAGVTEHGVAASTSFKFNAVTDYLFTPILRKIRRAAHGPRDAGLGTESEKFDEWVGQSYKFTNFAKRSLLAGDRVIQAILQPEIRTRALTLLGKTLYGLVSPTHICVLTDRELITVREERRSANDKYGGIWDYIPLGKIVELFLSQRDGHFVELSIQLPDVVPLKSLYRASAERELNELLDRYRELASSDLLTPTPEIS
jgi:hypothetical protein